MYDSHSVPGGTLDPEVTRDMSLGRRDRCLKVAGISLFVSVVPGPLRRDLGEQLSHRVRGVCRRLTVGSPPGADSAPRGSGGDVQLSQLGRLRSGRPIATLQCAGQPPPAPGPRQIILQPKMPAEPRVRNPALNRELRSGYLCRPINRKLVF